MSKNRKKIPDSLADKVVFLADRQCCICQSRGDQLHHIDGDPSNNIIDNIALLCYDHHHEASTRGGLKRKLSPGAIRHYRDLLHRRVESRRDLEAKSPVQVESVFDAVSDALAIRIFQHYGYGLTSKGPEEQVDTLCRIAWFLRHSGIRARQVLLELLLDVAYDIKYSRSKAGEDVASTVSRLTIDALWMHPLEPDKKRLPVAFRQNSINLAIQIGSQISYTGIFKLANLRIACEGLDLLRRVVQYTQRNRYRGLEKEALEEFQFLSESSGHYKNQDAHSLVEIFRKSGMKGELRFPEIPDSIEI